jgi:hypothetical protein
MLEFYKGLRQEDHELKASLSYKVRDLVIKRNILYRKKDIQR